MRSRTLSGPWSPCYNYRDAYTTARASSTLNYVSKEAMVEQNLAVCMANSNIRRILIIYDRRFSYDTFRIAKCVSTRPCNCLYDGCAMEKREPRVRTLRFPANGTPMLAFRYLSSRRVTLLHAVCTFRQTTLLPLPSPLPTSFQIVVPCSLFYSPE